MSLKDCYIYLLGERLNMMAEELFQLNNVRESTIKDYKKLICFVLTEIKNKNIKSCHFTPEQAQNALECLEIFDGKKNISDLDISSAIASSFDESEFNL